MRRLCIQTGIVFVLLLTTAGYAENIDPYNTDSQFAWGENIGWLNFEPSLGDGVHVTGERLTGYIWGENIGWISLSCWNTAFCDTVEYGVSNDGTGRLSGFAWGENVGWINFNPQVPEDPTHFGVVIDADGRFDGWAWGENIGWIRFDAAQPWNVRACRITIEDLANFASYWLQSPGTPANLDFLNAVDLEDFNLFARRWLDFCPDAWLLK
jgi:hypothetical protein